MKTVTFEEIKSFDPCWLNTKKGRVRLERYGKQRERWTALDVLTLKRVSPADRLWTVVREEFIDAPILHEFACLCGERALSWIDNPDSRSVAGIQAKRDWLQGKITREELRKAWDAARDAVVVAREAWDAVVVAWAAEAAAVAAWHAAAGYAAEAAAVAAWHAARTAGHAAGTAAKGAACEAWIAASRGAVREEVERQWQVDTLIGMLENAEGEK